METWRGCPFVPYDELPPGAQRVFPTREAAAEYAASINTSRDPLIIEGRWSELRRV